MKTRLPPLVRLLLPVVLASCTPDAPDATIVFRDVRVFDGHEVHERTTVVVAGDRIVAVAPDAAIPAEATVVEGAGRTLLPGLIDAHTHTGLTSESLEQALVFGVTTELDMFDDPAAAAGFRAEQASNGAPDRADVYSAGTLVTAPRGHGTQMGETIPTLGDPAGAADFVDQRIAEGSDYIKLVYDAWGVPENADERRTMFRGALPSIDLATLRAVVEAAHRRNRMAVVHVLNLRSAREAIEAGADGLVHLFTDSVPDERLVRRAADSGAFVIPTMTVLARYTGAVDATPVMEDSLLAPWLSPYQEANLELRIPPGDDWQERMETLAATVRRFRDAGVPILAGTDAANPGTAHGVSMHEELVLLTDAGLTATQALTAATAASAEAFGLADRGRIAPGFRADLVLVRGDPTTDIRDTRDIVGVWKHGVPLDRAGYRTRILPGIRDAIAGLGRPGTIRISDFEDGTPAAEVGFWWHWNDMYLGGTSSAGMSVVEGGANGTDYSLEIHGTLVPTDTLVAAGAMFNPNLIPYVRVDLSSKSELTFQARGDGTDNRVILYGRGASDFATLTFAAPREWTEVRIPLSSFAGIDLHRVVGFLFTGPEEAGDFAFRIDDVILR